MKQRLPRSNRVTNDGFLHFSEVILSCDTGCHDGGAVLSLPNLWDVSERFHWWKFLHFFKQNLVRCSCAATRLTDLIGPIIIIFSINFSIMSDYQSDSETDSEAEVSVWDIDDLSDIDSDDVSSVYENDSEEIESLANLPEITLPSFESSTGYSALNGLQEPRNELKGTPDTKAAAAEDDQWTRDFLEMLGRRYIFLTQT